MANFTKKAIRDSLVRLLNEKPLSQITIRDIVEDCGVNRNTFYYYYHDLPHLVESIVNEEADQMIRAYPSIDSIRECMDAMIAFALENKKAVLHIYHSVNRDLYEQYQWRVCEHAVTVYVDGLLAGRQVQEEDRQLMIDYMKCISFGLVIGWLEKGMEGNVSARFHRLCELKQGDLEQMILRSEMESNSDKDSPHA